MAEATLQLPLFFYVSSILKCYDCQFWIGRCLKGKVNRIAVCEACELFKPKDSFIAGKELSFFIDMNRIQNFSSKEKTKKTSNKRQAESFLTVKQSFLLQDVSAKLKDYLKLQLGRLTLQAFPDLKKLGKGLKGGPHKCRHLISPSLPKMAETVGGGPFSPGASPAPLQAP